MRLGLSPRPISVPGADRAVGGLVAGFGHEPPAGRKTASARLFVPSCRPKATTVPLGPSAMRSVVMGIPRKRPELMALSCGTMIVALDAGGNTPPTGRVTTLTAFAAPSVQATVTSPAGVVATRGESEIRIGSESVCAPCQTPLIAGRVASWTIELVYEQKKSEQVYWYSSHTSVTFPAASTASCGAAD